MPLFWPFIFYQAPHSWALALACCAPVFTWLQYKSFQNNVQIGEIAHNEQFLLSTVFSHNEQFLLFPQCFLPILKSFCHFHWIQNCRLQTLSVWKSLKFVIWERVKWYLMGFYSAETNDKAAENKEQDQTSWMCGLILLFTLCKINSWLQMAVKRLTHSHTMTHFDASGKQAFWKHCGKRRNCLLRAISPFPTVFSSCLDNFLPFSSNLKMSSANSFSLEESKICGLVMG